MVINPIKCLSSCTQFNWANKFIAVLLQKDAVSVKRLLNMIIIASIKKSSLTAQMI